MEALLIETSNAYAGGLLDGVVAFQRERESWSIYLGEQVRGASPLGWLRNWKGGGIIARIESKPIARMVKQTRLPVVDVSAARLLKDVPWVETDDREIARIAIEHLAERGFESLAFVGEPDFNWSRWREEEFVALAEQRGYDCQVFTVKSRRAKGYSWSQQRRGLRNWVWQLPKPTGVFACYDFAGQQVLDVCREIGVAVPEQVAVIGVDNDERLCQLCTPPLSSIIPDTRRAGYEAALHLDRMMQGKKASENAMLIPPVGIAERQSTDVFAIDDTDVVNALRYIRGNACRGISVSDVLKAVPLSRRKLEHRFLRLLNRTPHAEIIRIRMNRASQLLRETNLPLSEVTQSAGFSNSDYFSAAFKKYTGLSPRAYRKHGLMPRKAASDTAKVRVIEPE